MGMLSCCACSVCIERVLCRADTIRLHHPTDGVLQAFHSLALQNPQGSVRSEPAATDTNHCATSVRHSKLNFKIQSVIYPSPMMAAFFYFLIPIQVYITFFSPHGPASVLQWLSPLPIVSVIIDSILT